MYLEHNDIQDFPVLIINLGLEIFFKICNEFNTR